MTFELTADEQRLAQRRRARRIMLVLLAAPRSLSDFEVIRAADMIGSAWDVLTRMTELNLTEKNRGRDRRMFYRLTPRGRRVCLAACHLDS